MLELKLQGEDLLRLIEVCSKSGVCRLKLGKDIELTFGGQADPVKVPVAAQANAPLEREIEVESFAKAQAELRKEALENMKLEDPVMYERLIASGDLVDETTED